MSEEGIRDFLIAKRKAAARFSIANKALLPSNIEVQQALVEHQRLFQANEQPVQLRVLREAAMEAMEFFDHFRPRLIGSVFSGTANAHSDVNLHLFADAPEEVVFFLIEHDIPFETSERRLRVSASQYASFPAFTFGAGDVNFELTIFPRDAHRQPPLSPIDGRPMPRADLARVRALLDGEASD
jgi:hypothetical protein